MQDKAGSAESALERRGGRKISQAVRRRGDIGVDGAERRMREKGEIGEGGVTANGFLMLGLGI